MAAGTDHASIATEAKNCRSDEAGRRYKEDIGRDGFMKRAWEWKRNTAALSSPS